MKGGGGEGGGEGGEKESGRVGGREEVRWREPLCSVLNNKHSSKS